MEYGATMKQINCIRYFWSLLQADSGHMCFGLEFPFNIIISLHCSDLVLVLSGLETESVVRDRVKSESNYRRVRDETESMKIWS